MAEFRDLIRRSDTRKGKIAALVAALLLASCGDGGGGNGGEGPSEDDRLQVVSYDDLPDCDESLQGKTAVVEEDPEYLYRCLGGNWHPIAAEPGGSSSSGDEYNPSSATASSASGGNRPELEPCGDENDGETVRSGDTVRICAESEWRICSGAGCGTEYDTYGWDAAPDGTVRGGLITTMLYKYNAWSQEWVFAAETDTSYGLSGCTTLREAEVGVGLDGRHYICRDAWGSYEWDYATIVEYDTYGLSCSAADVGTVALGVVSADSSYYCSSTAGWVPYSHAWSWDVPKSARWNPDAEYGNMTDPRDWKTYRTVVIGGKTWMAENLNFAGDSTTPVVKSQSRCHGDDSARCTVAGRLYTWTAAMADADCVVGVSCAVAGRVRGVCPSGWHLPDTAEWHALFIAVGDSALSGVKLKASSGWDLPLSDYNAGTNDFGFTGLAAGAWERGSSGSDLFRDEGYFTRFWSSSESTLDLAYFMSLNLEDAARVFHTDKNEGSYVRCVMD